ncbi:MAG: zf-HC2 domain-containing protein, partial [Longimicrobiales bacterium]
MKTTDCAEVRDRLPELLAGALSGEVAVRLQGHLAHCDACSAEAALISRVRRAAVQAPAGLQARVASAAAGTSAPHVRPGRSMLPRRPTRRLSWALAAGVL